MDSSTSSIVRPSAPSPLATVEAREAEITSLLMAWNQGEGAALEHLMPLVVQELREIARRFFRRESLDHTLQPTAVVNELYLRMASYRRVSWKSRSHFFACAADAMRKILIDHSRMRRAKKRGNGTRPLPLDEVPEIEIPRGYDFLELDDALQRLAELDPRQERVVVLRVFAGLTHQEIAKTLGITTRTVKRDWRVARLWLHQELDPGSGS